MDDLTIQILDLARRFESAACALREAATAHQIAAPCALDSYEDAMSAVVESLSVAMAVDARVTAATLRQSKHACPRCAGRGTDGDHVCECAAGDAYRGVTP